MNTVQKYELYLERGLTDLDKEFAKTRPVETSKADIAQLYGYNSNGETHRLLTRKTTVKRPEEVTLIYQHGKAVSLGRSKGGGGRGRVCCTFFGNTKILFWNFKPI